jgi:A/G-specific adenine glycosylase
MDSNKLKRWFLQEKRDLPWRNNPTPYAVWISEVMLQQTQVATVLSYFENWFEKFPSIDALAASSLEDVIKAWEGLGYYSRARNIHAGAKFIIEHFQGKFPSNVEDMKKIKGLGPYTVNAIASFAFHKDLAPVDGNVFRVLTRYFHIEQDISSSKVQKQLRDLAQSILPKEDSWVHNEALIELGATICKKKPNCLECPLKHSCLSFKKGTASLLPINNKKTIVEKILRDVFVIVCEGNILIKKEKENKVMKDLHEFPYLDRNTFSEDISQITDEINQLWGISTSFKRFLKPETMSFTKYRLNLRPILFETKHIPSHYMAVNLEEAMKLPFSSGPRRILRELVI